MAVKKDHDIPISELVHQTRTLAHLTQNELAELAGVGKTLIFDLEKGHENIKFDNLKKVLRVLNIKIIFTRPPMIFEQSPKLPKKVKQKKGKG